MKTSNFLSKRVGLALLLLIVFTAVLFFFPREQTVRGTEVIAVQGELDLTEWDFEQDGIVNLKGEWEFYWGQLLTSSDFANDASHAEGQLVQVPNVWTNYEEQGENLPGKGYATYRLKVKTRGALQQFGLKIPDMSTACRIMIDERAIANCGQVADKEEQAVARFAPQVVHFGSVDDEFDIIVQVSNYLYDRGGMWYAMDLGTEVQAYALRENELAVSLILLGVFFFMGLYHMALFTLRPREKAALFFAVGCFIGALRLFVVDEMFLLNWIPDATVQLITGIIYFTYYGGVAVLTLYLRELYPEEISKLVSRLVVGASVVFIASTFLCPLSVYTHLIRYYHLLVIVLGVYMIACVSLAVWRKRDGSGLQFFGITFFVLAIFHDIYFNLFYISGMNIQSNTIQFLQRQVVLLGLFVLVFVQAIILARRFSKAFQTVGQMSKRLLALDRLKDEFLANTSHELKTPLHGIMNLSQSMIEGSSGPINETQKRNLTVMVSVARRLTNLIQDIMDFSKLKNSELKLDKRSFALQAIMHANMEVFQHYVADKPIRLNLQLPDELPLVYADENRVLQICYNLIGNAIKFTEAGQITISAECQESLVEVRVSDTGIGIPEDKLPFIFQSFEQVGATVSREYGGTGLGLSISKQLVELNGGQLGVQSKLGEGSTFSFTVPVSSEQAHQPMLHYSPRIVSWMPESISDLSKDQHAYTILAVDDDPANLQVIVNVLAQEPYRIIVAHDGEEALDILDRERKIDLVLLDVMMPKLSGYEVSRKIRDRYTLSELPILLATVKNEPEDMLSGFSAGANDFLVKPFYTHELRARVRTLLELKHSVEAAIHAELSFLRAQIKPHFLYNALNTIIGICPREPKEASFLLTELSHYLRGSFDFHNQEGYVSLEKELELLTSYVAIEKARFKERLEVVYEVDQSIVISIPPLSIQPLVENAIRHGVMKRIAGGRITIVVKQDAHVVYIEVVDNGVGIPEDQLAHLFADTSSARGVGLPNIHQRLKRTYGTGLALESRVGVGTKVKMQIPKEGRA